MTDPLVISSSQLDTFADCERKWWLSKVARLPEVPRGYLIFGTVLHACLERWASADEHGRVPMGPSRPKSETNAWSVRIDGPLEGQGIGEPVDVFPPGWETVEERGRKESVTPNEAALIRTLVEQAVERGIVQRGDGRVLEREFRLPVIAGVEIVGFIDVFVSQVGQGQHPDVFDPSFPEIGDHKTFGESSTRFLAQPTQTSPNYLGKNTQLLTYAAATSIQDGWDGPVVVRHNQFPKFKDERGPRIVEAVIQPHEWAERWAEIQEAAARMVKVRDIKRWDDVPGPYGTDACSKYGGCPFRDICGRRTTLDGYRGTVERQLEAKGSPRPNISTAPRKGEKQMTDDVFARKRARGAAPVQVQPPQVGVTPSAASTVPTSTPAAVGINGGAAPAPAAPAVPVNAPPWANPACTSCHGTGFNSRGHACPICDALAKRQKRPTSSMYIVQGDAQSGFTAEGRPEKVAEIFTFGAPQSWSSKGGSVAAPAQPVSSEPAGVSAAAKPVEIPAAVAPAAPTILPPVTASVIGGDLEVVSVKGTPEAVEAAAAGKRGRKPAGLTILVGCAQLKGPDRPTETAQGLLARLGTELAKDMGANSYWELDAFKRRDRIKQKSAEIAESLGKTVLIVAGVRDPDIDSLVSSLLPHAEIVVEGLR